MFRRRILDLLSLPPTRQLLTPVAYYTTPFTAVGASLSSRASADPFSATTSATAHARRYHHSSAAAFKPSATLRATQTPPPPPLPPAPVAAAAAATDSRTPLAPASPTSRAGMPGQPAMSQDGVEVPCSTQLTIGDVNIPVPDYALHPERVAWAAPGIDHTAPYLRKTHAQALDDAVSARADLPSLHGGGGGEGEEEENVFFSVQDPLTRSYLRWIAQKEQLGQDMCLIGDPGPAMRWLVMLYSHLTRREIRVVYLNSDITESDLKQRREIRNGSLIYDDQSAVSAAVEGQLLVLEGLERVERNVLPVVNNLLENREMHLDNGSVLIHPARYDSLLQKLYESKLQARERHSVPSAANRSLQSDLIAEAKHELAQMGLVRVSEKFRVIGITVPVPPYDGNPLDPPLRSRFQCLYVRTPLPVVAPSSSVVRALEAPAAQGTAGRKRSKEVAELQERQSVRFAQVAQLRAAITAINDSTRDFQLSKPSKKKPKKKAAAAQQGMQGRRYPTMYDSNDVVEQMFRDEGDDGDDATNHNDSNTSSSSSGPAAASSPLQTVGHWALATIAQQLALFPDLPVGEAVMRGFPWPYYARQITRGGVAGGSAAAATGYATVEEYHRRLGQYAEVLQHCHVYPPLLMAADLSSSAGGSGDGRNSRSHSTSPRAPAAAASRAARTAGSRLRAVMQGQGVDSGSGEQPSAAAARAHIRSAQLVSTADFPADGDTATHVIPAAVQQACNYIVSLRNATSTAAFSGVPVVVAEATVATAAHDAEHPGEAGTYTLPVFLGAGALPTGAAAQSGWTRDVASYLTNIAAPSTVFTTEHYHVLQTMLHVHASRQHLCLLGPTGCGKTAMVRAFGRLLGYEKEDMLTMHLYADMTNKDLFQQRMTDPQTGNTTWQDSPLLHAAIYGKLVVLDGMEKLPAGMLSSLQQLLVDQCAVLADGTILKPPTEYTMLKAKMTQRDEQTEQASQAPTDAEMRARKIFPVHPAFRVVATARPPMPVSGGSPSSKGGRDFYVTHDLTTLFRMVAMPDAGEDALGPVLRQVAAAEVRAVMAETWRQQKESAEAMLARSEAVVEQLMQLRGALEALHAADGKMPQLSLRQLRQLVRAAVRYPTRVLESVRNTLLLPLMTGVSATKVQHALESCGLAEAAEGTSGRGAHQGRQQRQQQGQQPSPAHEQLSLSASGGRVWSVGGQPVLQLSRVYSQTELALVPFVTGFHTNRVHESILAWLAKQYAMRSNILLIGNQGVGKNKVVDAFLSRLAIPRHYIQLHRDTTVGSLTINPTVEAGRVIWEDSPLVKAVQQGHCLVVDEIDKAPVEVVQVLKGLIEDREMRLGDGRLIFDPELQHAPSAAAPSAPAPPSSSPSQSQPVVSQRIAIHPDFRIIVLANPPGFPFHGNDFFRECGDLFAAYVMGNPDAESQLRVLSAYAPTLPRRLLEQLVAVFIELQNAFTQGNLTYPFSLRELIAVVRHMSRYPQDGVYGALNNVFNFDARDENTLRYVRQVLGHYLQTMVDRGGVQRLQPYGAGQAVPLVPFKALVTLPLHSADPQAPHPGALQDAMALPAEVTVPSSRLLAVLAEAEKAASTHPSRRAAPCKVWRETYPTSAFMPDDAAAQLQSKPFSEYVGLYQLPFKNALTDTVLCMAAYNALGDDAASLNGDGGSDAPTLPLLSVVMLRDPEAPQCARPDAPASTSPPVCHRQIIVATVRLPPSPLDARHLLADAAQELATLWPVGETRFVDVTECFAAEMSPENSQVKFDVTALQLAAEELPWRAEASSSAPRDGEGGAEQLVWPPSLASCAPSTSRLSLRHAASLRPQHSGTAASSSSSAAAAMRAERAPRATLLLRSTASLTGSVVLLDALAGSTSELYLSRVGLRAPSTTAATNVDATSHAAAEGVNDDGVSHATTTLLGPVLPLHLPQLVAAAAAAAAAAPEAPATARVLDVCASRGVFAFAAGGDAAGAAASSSPTHFRDCFFFMGGQVVRVTLPHPLRSLRFVGESGLAMVEMANTTSTATNASAAAAASRGILKVCISADGAAQASLLPLPASAQHLELVDAVPSFPAAIHADGGAAQAAHISAQDLAGSVWRVRVGGSHSGTRGGAVTAAQSRGEQTASAADKDDPMARDVVYGRVEAVQKDGLGFRFYRAPAAPTTSTTTAAAAAAASVFADDAAVLVDGARHQLLQLNADRQTFMAVDTQHHTLRPFATLPSTTPDAPIAGAPVSVNTSSGTSYLYEPRSQMVNVADVDAERVRQRYAEWSSLLSGKADTVGDSATVEDGEEDVKDFKMKYSTPRKQPSGTLKHGEVDDKEHHGGNTWAGGTGGTDTAGLGGMIGPYRLDKGNEVHQVSPEEKRKVPKHLIEEARRMGREALKERLQEIGMTEAEYDEYRRLQERVRPAVAQLRMLLMGLKAAEGERVWVTGQTDGVWDDKKLVEGIVGEKNVYKRRVDSKETNPFQQKHKKRLVFVLDVSASMYRFNSMDQRLTKLLETTVMVMEAFAGFESKLDYAMIGHNGDSDNIPLVNFGAPPANQKERMIICQKMIAYAQYCWSGDNTVESMRRSVELVTKEKGDSYFVFVVSDANLQRYGISPRELTEIIQSKPEVKMFCIFIATLGAQASHLQQQLPAGHGFECMRTDLLPQVMRQIFVSANLF